MLRARVDAGLRIRSPDNVELLLSRVGFGTTTDGFFLCLLKMSFLSISFETKGEH